MVQKDGDVGKICNIGSGTEHTNLEVAHEVLDAIDADHKSVEDYLEYDQ